MQLIPQAVSKIKWAPILRVSLKQRIEILSVGLYAWYILFGQTTCLYLFYRLLFSQHIYLRTAFILYLIFVYYDRNCGHNGGRGNGLNWVKNWFIWKYTAEYFPINIVKTVDLPADRHYIFANFPHGIVATGTFIGAGTGNSKWKELFPGIRAKLTTLNYHTCFPLFREIILSLGVCTSSYRCLHRILNQSTDPAHQTNRDGFTANAAFITVGGAQEAINSRPKNYRLNLKTRKGFVKAAIFNGTPLVPVFSFGEVDIYDQAESIEGTRWHRFRENFKRFTGILPCLINGRGLFQHSFGIIPRRRPITIVIGAPIEVERNANPSNEQIDKLHDLFSMKLKSIFEEHKVKYIENHENVQLIID